MGPGMGQHYDDSSVAMFEMTHELTQAKGTTKGTEGRVVLVCSRIAVFSGQKTLTYDRIESP